jgi:hypothetical protein
MSDEAPGVGPEERVRESTAVTSGAEATQPSAADDNAGEGEAAPVSSGGEPGVVGEGAEDISNTSGAVASAPARADDEGVSSTRPWHDCVDRACVSGATTRWPDEASWAVEWGPRGTRLWRATPDLSHPHAPCVSVDDEPLNMLSFIKVVTQEWPQELKDELARTPHNFIKIRDRLGLRDFCCGTCERPQERKIVD